MTRSLTLLIIFAELALTASLFIPFVEWPKLFKRIRMAHIILGLVLSYIVFNLVDKVPVELDEIIVFGLLWVTYTSIYLFTL